MAIRRRVFVVALACAAVIALDLSAFGNGPRPNNPLAAEASNSPDTAQEWERFMTAIDLVIADERRGMEPPIAGVTWMEYWANSILVGVGSKEINQVHVEYIVDARARAGLPALPDDLTAFKNSFQESVKLYTSRSGSMLGMFAQVIDDHVRDEKDGRTASGFESWEEFWANSIKNMKRYPDTAEKDIQYVIQARKRAGLPDLPREIFFE